MSTLLEKALEKVVALPKDEQDAIASQILASLDDEEAWKKRFAEKRDVIRRMAREAIAEDDKARQSRWTTSSNAIAGDTAIPAFIVRSAGACSGRREVARVALVARSRPGGRLRSRGIALLSIQASAEDEKAPLPLVAARTR